MTTQEFKQAYPELAHLEGNALWDAMEDKMIQEPERWKTDTVSHGTSEPLMNHQFIILDLSPESKPQLTMSIKKIIRILISPLVFIMVMASVTVIPVGPICLIMGVSLMISDVFREEKRSAWDRAEDREMMWSWILLPWHETMHWIRTGNLMD